MMPCDWCGHLHDKAALCAKRPRWGRRGFLQLMGAAALGAALPTMSVVDPSRRVGAEFIGNTVRVWFAPGASGPWTLVYDGPAETVVMDDGNAYRYTEWSLR